MQEWTGEVRNETNATTADRRNRPTDRRKEERNGRRTEGTQCRSPAAVKLQQTPSRHPCNHEICTYVPVPGYTQRRSGDALAEIPDLQILFRLGSFARPFGLGLLVSAGCLLVVIGADCLLA